MRAVTLICDLSEGAEPAVVTRFPVCVQGQWYSIDLGENGLKFFTDLMGRVAEVGTKLDGPPERHDGVRLKIPGLAGDVIAGQDGGDGEQEVPVSSAAAEPPARPPMTKRAETEWRNRVRAWAREHGWPKISSHGYLPQGAGDAYEAAHPDDIGP